MKITAILAMTDNCLIGKNNSLPWNIPEDMKHFRNLTNWNVVIMWKNTYFSLPEQFRPLPNRRNIVFTSEKIPNIECVKNFSELESLLQDENKKIFLIGWAKLYNYFFENNYIDEVELTLLDFDYDWDIFVNDFRKNFVEKSRQKFSDWYFISLIKNNLWINENNNT